MHTASVLFYGHMFYGHMSMGVCRVCVGVASYSDVATEQQKCCVHASHCTSSVWPVHTGIHRHTQTHK